MSDRVCRLSVAIAATFVAHGAQASLPSVHSLGRVEPTPSGIVNSKYRNGDDGTGAIPLLWGTCPAVSLTESDTISYNLRTTCGLVEPGTPLATMSIFSGTLPTGCVMADLAGADGINDGFTCTTPVAGTASLVARATRNADVANSTAFQVTVTAAGTDSTAPTIPLSLAGVDNADGTGSLTWLASSDPVVSGIVTGVASYQVKLGGSQVAVVTAPSANVQPTLAETRIGATDNESSSQAGADWTMTFGGAGLVAAADHVLLRAAQVTGDFVATAKITAYTPSAGTTGSIGIAARASTAVGALAAYARWKHVDSKCNLRYRWDTASMSNGTSTSGTYSVPIWIRLERSGDNFSAYCSSDGTTFTLTSTQTVATGTTVYVGPFITSGTASTTTATGTVAQFNIYQGSAPSYLYTGAGGSFTVNAYDGATRSSDSAAITLTPTGGTPPPLVTVPAVTSTCGPANDRACTVCNSIDNNGDGDTADPGESCTFSPGVLSVVVSSAANATANGIGAGDSIELRADAAGGTTEWAARILCSAVSGSTGNPIWFAVRDGDRIRLDAATAPGVGLLDMTNCDYWNIVGSRDGTSVGFELSDREQRHQPPAIHDNPPTYYQNSHALVFRDVDGTAVIGTTIGGGYSYESSSVDKNSSDLLFKYVDIGRQGAHTYDTGNTGAIESAAQGTLSSLDDADNGEVWRNCGTRVVYEDMKFHHSGHKQMHVCGPYQVIRRGEFNGNWADLSTYPQFTGNHSGTFQVQLNLSDWNTATVFGPLVEDSLFYGVGSEPEHKLTNETIQMSAKNMIFRQNYIVQRSGPDGYWGRFGPHLINACAGSGSILTTDYAAYLQVYHNTLWGGAVTLNSGTLPLGTYSASTCAEWKVKNNLFQGQQYSLKTGSSVVNDYTYTVNVTTNGPNTGYANAWKGAEWMNNIFGTHPADAPAASFYRVNLGSKSSGSGTGIATLTDTTTWPSNWTGNTDQRVTWAGGTTTAIANFVADALPDPDTMRDTLTLSVSSASGVGDAPALTTVDAVTDTTHISLASGRYFKDEWSITETWDGLHTEYGDCIAIGATAAAAVTARITDIDYSNGNITFTPARTITNGHGVWKAADVGDGTCGAVWDNRGAAQ